MFNFLRKKELFIMSPMNGKVIPIDEVDDEAFSKKVLGDGVGIIPKDGIVLSPVNGVITQVFDTLHAYGIKSDDGAELLIHIGINTVELEGQGFTPFVQSGEKVKIGDKIVNVNINFLKEKGYSPQTPIVLTNTDSLKNIKYITGDATSAKTPIISYNI